MIDFSSFIDLFFGKRVSWQDLVTTPLTSQETLREDKKGICRRVLCRGDGCKGIRKWMAFIAVRVNPNGHLKAIENLLDAFYEEMLCSSLITEEKMRLFYDQAEALQALKNDYGFRILHIGDPSFIRFRLDEIKKELYFIFSSRYYFHTSKERLKRSGHLSDFLTISEKHLERIVSDGRHTLGLLPLLSICTIMQLEIFFNAWLVSLKERKQALELILENLLFSTISSFELFLSEETERKRQKIEKEVSRALTSLQIELVCGCKELLKNHGVSPFKEEIVCLLKKIRIETEEENYYHLVI